MFLSLRRLPTILVILLSNLKEKSLLNLPPIKGGLLHPPTMKSFTIPSELSKTGQITPQMVFGRLDATVIDVLLQ
jgi:hypothetical protein